MARCPLATFDDLVYVPVGAIVCCCTLGGSAVGSVINDKCPVRAHWTLAAVYLFVDCDANEERHDGYMVDVKVDRAE